MLNNILQKLVEFFQDYGMRRAIYELRKHSAYRQTYNELSKLSDKELNDIGINRGMIHELALDSLMKHHKNPVAG